MSKNDVEHYLESISIFYDEKLKFLSMKDNFLKCKGCPDKKVFKETHEEITLSCGGKDGDKDCGLKMVIKFPKYVHYEKDMEYLKKELENEFNYEKINEFVDVKDKLKEQNKKRTLIEEKMKEITDKFHKLNVDNKKKDIENFYISRVDKTKRCREILKDINKFEESEKVLLRKEYISLIKKLNTEYIEIKTLVETFQPFHTVKKPEVSLIMDVENEKPKKKIIKKKVKKGVKELIFNSGDIVHWVSKDKILSGFVVGDTEKGAKKVKIKTIEGKKYMIDVGIVNKGEHEPEPQQEEEKEDEEENEEEVQVEEVNIDEQDKLYYFSNSKQNKWLSSFNKAQPFKYNGIEYPTVEHAFHAQKLSDDDPEVENYRYALSTNVADVLPPNEAKKFGGKKSFKENGFTLRSDWEKVKLKLMEEITREYYDANSEFIHKLVNTGEKLLVHKGFRIDDYWGVKGDDKGKNNHGNILMKLREEFKNA